MKKFISVLAICAMLLSMFAVCSSAATPAGLKDSGIDYTESTKTIANPMTGYPATPFVYPEPGKGIPVRNDTGFQHYFIDMKFFSGGYTMMKVDENGEIVMEPKYDENGNPLLDENGKQVYGPIYGTGQEFQKFPLNEEQKAQRMSNNGSIKWEWANGSRNTGGGEDIPLDEPTINSIRATLENLRKNGGTCLIRPEYAADASQYSEPYDFEILMTHVKQLAEIITEYSDVVGGVEVGTIGPYGEMWGSPYCGAKESKEIISTYINNTPDTVKFMVRTPGYILNFLCDDANNDTGTVYLKDGSKKTIFLGGEGNIAKLIDLLPCDNLRDMTPEFVQRLAMFNDGYMLTGGDTGTWGIMSRSDGVKWLEWAAYNGYYGGEYGSGPRPADTIWLPENALPEMYRTHVSYIHGNVYRSTMDSVCTWNGIKKSNHDEAQKYVNEWVEASKTITENDPVGAVMDPATVEIVDNSDGTATINFTKIGYDQIPFTEELAKLATRADVSAYYGYSCYTFIHNHMGYVFVVRKSELTPTISKGGLLQMNVSIENTGFGNCVQDKVAQLLLVKDGKEVECIDLDDRVNPNAWYTQEVSDFTIECKIASTLEAGDYDVYLRVCNVTNDGKPNTKTCVQFSNNGGIYDKTLNANRLGSFTLAATLESTVEKSAQSPACKTHTFGEWTTSLESNCVAIGSEKRTCTVCGFYEHRLTDAHLIDPLWTIDKQATNRAFGSKSHHCLRGCGYTTDVTPIPMMKDIDKQFPDVAQGKWYYEAIRYAVNTKLFNGVSETEFKPNNVMNRGMLVSVLYRMEGSPFVSAKDNTFKDVAAGKYYTDAVIWASTNEIVNGTGEGVFSPTNNITREQMAAILYRYAQYKGFDTSKSANLNSFPDGGKTSNYAKEALSWANAAELITGTSAGAGSPVTLNPKGSATRAQVATILMRFETTIATHS